jgi:[ribosomal protein S5]-alanine N-acetyltransferase
MSRVVRFGVEPSDGRPPAAPARRQLRSTDATERLAAVRLPTIRAPRLELVSLPPAVLVALLEGRRHEAARIIGASIPEWWPDAIDTHFLRVRLAEMQHDPAAQQWLVRALLRRGSAPEMVGHAGFHGPPERDDPTRTPKLELGYAIFPAFQCRGYAIEAASALMGWAHSSHDIHRFVASVAPDNHPSLTIVRSLGFVQTGKQWDDEDGLELVFELETTDE